MMMMMMMMMTKTKLRSEVPRKNRRRRSAQPLAGIVKFRIVVSTAGIVATSAMNEIRIGPRVPIGVKRAGIQRTRFLVMTSGGIRSILCGVAKSSDRVLWQVVKPTKSRGNAQGAGARGRPASVLHHAGPSQQILAKNSRTVDAFGLALTVGAKTLAGILGAITLVHK